MSSVPASGRCPSERLRRSLVYTFFSKKDFAKRLLLNKSASSDAEKSMLLKLKEGRCGSAVSISF